MFRLIPPAIGLALAVPLLAAKCGDDRTRLVGGEVVEDSLTAYRALDYQLTSDRYRLWQQAQSTLDTVDLDLRVRLDTRRLTDEDIDRAVEELANVPRARAAIESAGLSVRDYVLTTIALAQSWDAVSRPSARFSAVPKENVAFLRGRLPDDDAVRIRPRARFLHDDSDDSDSESERRGRRNRGGRDSDTDS